jgi:hypothetical protein
VTCGEKNYSSLTNFVAPIQKTYQNVSIDFRILFGKLKPDEKPQNIIASFLLVLATFLKLLKLLGTLLKDALLEKLADLLEKDRLLYFALALALKRFAKSYGIELYQATECISYSVTMMHYKV